MSGNEERVRTSFEAEGVALLTVSGPPPNPSTFACVDQLAERTSQPVLVVFQDSRFCPLTSELPVRYERDIRKIDASRTSCRRSSSSTPAGPTWTW